MASPTTRLRAMLQAYNTNPEAWGEFLNTALQMLDNGFGVTEVFVDGETVLEVADYIEHEAQKAGLLLYGGGGPLIVPARDRIYLVRNNCDDDIEIKPEGGTGAIVRVGTIALWMTDGSVSYVVDPSMGELRPAEASIDANSQKLVNVAAGTDATDAATLANKVHQFAAPTSALAMNAQKITGLASGVDSTDAVNKGQMDAVVGSATAAAASASAAASSASAASTSASNASTSATNAASSASAASTSASAASTSATAASGSASTATTQASAASTSATNAAASATTAGTSATTASTQATNAATSATNASNSASTASTAATSSATSATASSDSADDAADSATLAYQWANNPVGVAVSGGEFSAYHWAVQAAASGFDPDDYYDKTATDALLAAKVTGFADPDADRLLFWDDSAGAYAALTAGTGLSITTTTMSVVSASATVAGIVELATDAETQTGTDTARAITPANLAARTATTTRTGILEIATTAEVRSSATGDKALIANNVEDACALVTLTDAATVTVDWDAFINGVLTMTANRTLGNPSNVQVGTSRTFIILSNSGTSRTPAFGSNYKGAPTDSVTNTSALIVSLFAYSATQIICSSKLVTI